MHIRTMKSLSLPLFQGFAKLSGKEDLKFGPYLVFRSFFFASNGVSAPGAFVGAKNLQECDKHARKQEGAVEV